MKLNLRLGDCYALTKYKLKQYKIRYISLLAVLTIMCLYARAQRPDSSGPVLSGIVIGNHGNPMVGATIAIEGSSLHTQTDSKGYFSLIPAHAKGNLVISFLGYETERLAFDAGTVAESITIKLQKKTNLLDEPVVIGYGTTNQRHNTGSVSKVSQIEIANTPAFNPIAALSGRVSGLVVTQSNGVPGSSHHVQLRGRNSITQGSEPLYIIDGVPFATGGEFLNSMGAAVGSLIGTPQQPASGLSPFNLINAEDILSIEILKDADALAIYGSRGANGVILITTKAGEAGPTIFNASIGKGIGKAHASFRFLNTPEYVAMRKEALKNDGVEPSANPNDPGYAPDIMLWDTTRYTNLQKLLTGGTAKYTNYQLSASGGTTQTRFYIGSAYKKESAVFPGGQYNDLASVNSRLSHRSLDGRLLLSLTSTISRSVNRSTASDLSTFLWLPPTVPALYDSKGDLNWEENGYRFDNPLSYLERTYKAVSEGGIHNLSVSYELFKDLTIKANVGYNLNKVDERAATPQRAFDPDKGLKSSTRFANGASSHWIVEPQVSYGLVAGKSKFDFLLGGSWQHTERSNRFMRGDGFADDLLMGAIASAEDIMVSNSYSQYRYQALFGRITYNIANKYSVNLSGRRDGSSRFGPGRQYANFGAVGIAYIISNERFLEKNRILSFAKFRGSYGVTGNDQISDYQYLDAWEPTSFHYTGGQGINPVRLFNPNYAWETNRKLEAAFEMGFFKDKVLVTTAFYQNRSSNQLINYRLPIQAGFQSILRNFDALVQNQGWEFSAQTQQLEVGQLRWDVHLNLSIHRNKLLKFPNLASSSYANALVIGKSLGIRQGYEWLGVNPETGIHEFRDVDGSGGINGRADYVILGDTDPKFYGGFGQTLLYRGFGLDMLFDFRKQTGLSYLIQSVYTMAGREFNQPSVVLDRWQTSRPVTSIQRFGALTGTDAYPAFQSYFRNSSGIYTDASFVRLRSATLSKTFTGIWLSRYGINHLKVNIQGQNLFTWSEYKVGHPETQNYLALPPLRTFHLGINFQF